MGYVVMYTAVNNIVFVGVSENAHYAPPQCSDASIADAWIVAIT